MQVLREALDTDNPAPASEGAGRAAGGRLTQSRGACEGIGDTEAAGRPPGRDSLLVGGSGSSAGERRGPGAVGIPVPSLWSLDRLPPEQPGL